MPARSTDVVGRAIRPCRTIPPASRRWPSSKVTASRVVPGRLMNDRAAVAGQCVQQAALADVRPPRQHDAPGTGQVSAKCFSGQNRVYRRRAERHRRGRCPAGFPRSRDRALRDIDPRGWRGCLGSRRPTPPARAPRSDHRTPPRSMLPRDVRHPPKPAILDHRHRSPSAVAMQFDGAVTATASTTSSPAAAAEMSHHKPIGGIARQRQPAAGAEFRLHRITRPFDPQRRHRPAAGRRELDDAKRQRRIQHISRGRAQNNTGHRGAIESHS